MVGTITFDDKTFKNFKREYNNAVVTSKKIFIFEGHKFLTDYAKYVIEYVNSQLN